VRCAGKRTIGGLLDDGLKSIVRYYLNNFQVRLQLLQKLAREFKTAHTTRFTALVQPNRSSVLIVDHCNGTHLQAIPDQQRIPLPVFLPCGYHAGDVTCDLLLLLLLLLFLQDGHKQDALDLLSGAYKVKKDVKLTFQRQHSPLIPIIIALAALGYALTSATALAEQRTNSSSHPSSKENAIIALGQHVVAPLLLAVGLLALVGRHGRMLVDRPQLCPQLAHTVAAAESSAAAKQ
jgi:hypothetical protein